MNELVKLYELLVRELKRLHISFLGISTRIENIEANTAASSQPLSITSVVNSNNQPTGTGWVGNTYTSLGELNDYSYIGCNLQTDDDGGILYFDFSQDGINWSSYPVAGFTILENINEVHTAWKGGRYVRIRYVGSGNRTYFRLQTFYSNHSLPLSAPLNQSINSDQDAQIVRAVGIGESPTGTYLNNKGDGIAFKTTASLNAGATFNSGVLSLLGYTQVSTQIICNENGTLKFIFGSSSSMSGSTPGVNDVNRVITLAYKSSDGFQLFSAPAFTDYVRYEFTNDGASPTTHLLFETKFLTKALSGQLLGLNAGISAGMVANLGRNVIVGQEPDGSFQNERKDGEAFKTTTPLTGAGVYTSSLISTHGFSQIETRIYSNQPGTLIGRWYADVNKTLLTRTFTRPYSGTEVGGTSYFAAPMFGDYLEYEYTNGATPQTEFNLELHLITKAISGQILGINDFIPSSVVANLGRNVIVGQEQSGNFENVSVTQTTNDAGVYHNLNVVSGARPSQLPGRTPVRIVLNSVATDTLLRTNTLNKTLYITDLLLTVNNSDNSSFGLIKFRDGTVITDPIVLPLLIQESPQNETAVVTISHSFNEALSFGTGVFLEEDPGINTVSGILIGYEE